VRHDPHTHGRAGQVDPIKPKLKPPGTKRLKLDCDVRLSTSAFKFILRRYIMAVKVGVVTAVGVSPAVGLTWREALVAGWCKLNA